jgi:hypothetical protein
VAADTPEDVWVDNNAGLKYGAVGEHEVALSWLTRGLELGVRTGDPERLEGQLRELRAASLSASGREPDALQSAVPTRAVPGRLEWPSSLTSGAPVDREVTLAGEPAGQVRVAVAWLPAAEYAAWPARWPDLVDSPLCHDEGGNRSATRCTAGGWRAGCGLTGRLGWLA